MSKIINTDALKEEVQSLSKYLGSRHLIQADVMTILHTMLESLYFDVSAQFTNSKFEQPEVKKK